MYTIKIITTAQTFAVRQPVLRPGKPVESCHFDGDDLPTTVHFGIYQNEELLGIASIFKAAHTLFTQEAQYQLRGMAVLDSHQKKGLGQDLVRAAENYVATQSGEIVWFNAREIAVPFYEKLGYAAVGGVFDIPDVGPHYVMSKNQPFR